MKRICAAALVALSLAACGSSTMGNRAGIDRDGGRTVTDSRNNTASGNRGGTGDGTMSGGTSDNWGGRNGTASGGTGNGTASDNWGGTGNGTTSGNWGGTMSGGASDTWGGRNGTASGGTATDNHRTASDTWNDTAAGHDGDTGKRSVTERASDALENGVENARESVNR
ncbi:MAG: hypothetical protein IKO14_02705 [Oscillibacter sp.]|nr:hypothetical protein [Oscillibacter sp.]